MPLKSLRTLLGLIDRIVATGDHATLADIHALVENEMYYLPLHEDIVEYLYGLIERMREPKETYYRYIADEYMEELKDRIYRPAFGDFISAARALEVDVGSHTYFDREHYGHITYESDVFIPDYFNTDDDRAAWSKARKAIQEAVKKDNARIAEGAITKLRGYMQRYHGPLLNVYTIHLLSDDHSHGATIRLVWIDNAFRIEGGTEKVVAHLKKLLTNKSEAILEPLPESIDNFTITNLSHEVLFRHEL